MRQKSPVHQSVLVPLTMLSKEEGISGKIFIQGTHLDDVIMIASVVLVEVKNSVHEDNTVCSYYRILLSNEK